jgi:uncharacterized protein HemY
MNLPAMDTDHFAAGRASLRRADWSEAEAHFRAVLKQADSPEARDGLGLALWWLNEVSAAHEQRIAAYLAYKGRGDL